MPRRGTRSSTTSIRARRRERRRPHFLRRAWRFTVARRTRLHRRRDRRHGHAVAIEEIPRGVFRRHGRQHAARPGGRHEGTGAALSRGSTSSARASGVTLAAVSPRPPRCSTFRTSSRSASRRPATTTTATTRTTGPRSGRACSEERRRHQQLRQPGQPELRQEPEGQAAARARHDGQQRAAVQHAAGGRRVDQGEQGLRVADAAQPRPRVRQRAVHDAPALGLLRAQSAGCGAAGGVRAEGRSGTAPTIVFRLRTAGGYSPDPVA